MKTLLIPLFAIISSMAISQTSYNLNWGPGINGSAASLLIETGDTVIWTWIGSNAHTVTSLAGAAESFDSGSITGAGMTYSHVFTAVGVNDYECTFHPSTMFGTITVQAAASIQEQEALTVNFFPNPVVDDLTLNTTSQMLSYSVYDSQGAEVLSGELASFSATLDFSSIEKGVYFVKVRTAQEESTFNVVKR